MCNRTVRGADGKTDLVYNGSTSNPSYNLYGAGGLLGQVKRTGAALNRSYHLKDHLGSVRVTVSPTMIVENFGSDLSQWTLGSGSGFALENGVLSASSAGDYNVLVNSSSTVIGDGVAAFDASQQGTTAADLTMIVRYQDANNFYMVAPYGNQLQLYKRLAGTASLMTWTYLPMPIANGVWHHLEVTLNGANIKVKWDNQQLITWTDPSSPFLSGKVPARQS